MLYRVDILLELGMFTDVNLYSFFLVEYLKIAGHAYPSHSWPYHVRSRFVQMARTTLLEK